MSNQRSNLISSLVKSIKVPTSKDSVASQDRQMAEQIFNKLSSDENRAQLDFLRASFPDLAAAYEANPTDKGFILKF
jgi:hypothetical protein